MEKDFLMELKMKLAQCHADTYGAKLKKGSVFYMRKDFIAGFDKGVEYEREKLKSLLKHLCLVEGISFDKYKDQLFPERE